MSRIVSLSISGPTYGIGHTSRQQALLEQAELEGWKTLHLVITELDPILPQLNELLGVASYSTCLVIDLDPRFVEKHKFDLIKILSDSRLECVQKIVFDSKSNFPIRNLLNTINFELGIYPFGNLGQRKSRKELLGFGYSIFTKSLQDIRNTKVYSNKKVQNVLVSCGGSDPLNFTSFYLRTLDDYSESELNIKLIIGRFFSEVLVREIRRLADLNSHKVEIVQSPLNLNDAFAFSDISLVTGGLTRNESMFCGVCTVVADLNQEQFESTNLFASKNAVVGLGVLRSDGVNRKESAAMAQIRSILSNHERQITLIENAKLCFPENGASRVLAEIGDVCLKQT